MHFVCTGKGRAVLKRRQEMTAVRGRQCRVVVIGVAALNYTESSPGRDWAKARACSLLEDVLFPFGNGNLGAGPSNPERVRGRHSGEKIGTDVEFIGKGTSAGGRNAYCQSGRDSGLSYDSSPSRLNLPPLHEPNAKLGRG